MEVWKDIRGYEGYYQVSSHGRVRSLDRVVTASQDRYKEILVRRMRGKVLKQALDGKGYYQVGLCLDGKPRSWNVHRLVAIHFVPNKIKKPAVNHINSNCLDNRVANLEWCTIAENNEHTMRMGRNNPPRGVDHYRARLTEDEALAIKYMLSLGNGSTKIANTLSLPYNSVRNIYRGRTWKHILY